MKNSMSTTAKAKPMMSKKAGPKKIFGSIVTNFKGVVVSGQRKTKDYGQGNGYIMDETERTAPVIPPKGSILEERLHRVRTLEANTNKASFSDPFTFDRMRAHVRSGILIPSA